MARTDSDAALVALARRGDRDGLARLVQRCWPVAWKAAFAVTLDRPLADDVAQEAVERALASLDRFDSQRPLDPWVRRIAVNRALDEVRRERRASAHAAAAAAERRAWHDDADHASAALADAVAALPADRRVAVVLHYWLDYGIEEIAQLVGVPVGTISSRLSRARAELRQAIEERGEDAA